MDSLGATGEQYIQAEAALKLMAGAMTERCLVTAERTGRCSRGRAVLGPSWARRTGRGISPVCLATRGSDPSPGQGKKDYLRGWLAVPALHPPAPRSGLAQGSRHRRKRVDGRSRQRGFSVTSGSVNMAGDCTVPTTPGPCSF